MQLSAVGYNAELLRSEFNKEKIRPLAEEATHHGGKHSQAPRGLSEAGDHITLDNMTIAAKIENQEREIVEMEKENRYV